MATDWNGVADRLANHCPSETYRRFTVDMLSTVDALGPLGPAENEFRRAYRFLHYNDPKRLLQLAQDFRASENRRTGAVRVKTNAWNYLVGIYDMWILRARIFFLAAGIIEDSLRSRLNARLTDARGPAWPNEPGLLPSSVVEDRDRDRFREREGRILAILNTTASLGRGAGAGDEHVGGEAEDGDDVGRGSRDDGDEHHEGNAARKQLEEIRLVMGVAPQPLPDGAEFVHELTLGQIRAFVGAKRLWKAPTSLEGLFQPKSSPAPARSEVDANLQVVQNLRNDVAHYRPHRPFSTGLFAAAKLARWMDVDLQHVYGSIDTRASTELSHLLEDHLKVLSEAVGSHGVCCGDKCGLTGDLDILMSATPLESTEVRNDAGARRACIYHRVHLRAQMHRAE